MSTLAKITFGLALDMGPGTGDLRSRLREVRPLLSAAQHHAFDSVWLGESYRSEAVGFHVPNPLLALAALAPHTTMRLGTGVTLLPAWHPLRLAYDAAMLDQLTNGRLTLGIGLGSPDLWNRYGIRPGTVGTYVDEALAMMQALWRGEAAIAGELFTAAAAIHPLPVQSGGPPLLIGGKIGRSLRRAAEYGAGYYASTSDAFADVKHRSRGYRAALAARGRDPRKAVVAVNRLTVVAPSAQEAMHLGRRYGGKVLSHYASLSTSAPRVRAMLTSVPGFDEGRNASQQEDIHVPEPTDGSGLFDRLRDKLCLVGTPTEVAAQVQRYADAGVTHIQARVAPADLPIEKAIKSVELLGREVLPRFCEKAAN